MKDLPLEDVARLMGEEPVEIRQEVRLLHLVGPGCAIEVDEDLTRHCAALSAQPFGRLTQAFTKTCHLIYQI